MKSPCLAQAENEAFEFLSVGGFNPFEEHKWSMHTPRLLPPNQRGCRLGICSDCSRIYPVLGQSSMQSSFLQRCLFCLICTSSSGGSAPRITWGSPGLCHAALCCTYGLGFGLALCCTAPWLQADLGQLTTKEPAGESRFIPAITPPAWPCLYLEVQKVLV